MLGWAVLILLAAGMGCDHLVSFKSGEGDAEAGKGERAVSYAAAGTKEIDVSGNPDTGTEEDALKAYFKGKQLLSAAYFAKDEARAKQYSAEAERWFEKSLRFFVPDIEAMMVGKKPTHPSANWEFLKGLHEAWSESIKLSGKRLASKEYVDRNVKDAWALSVISRMIESEPSEEKRRELIAGKFPEVREILAGTDRYAGPSSGKGDGAARKRTQTAQARTASAAAQDRLPTTPTHPSPTGALVRVDVAASKAGLREGLVAEDPLTGKAAFVSGTMSNQPLVTASVAKDAVSGEPENFGAGFKPGLAEWQLAEPTAGREIAKGRVVDTRKSQPQDVLAIFRRFAPSPAKIYLGDRLYTLGATPGKLYIGGRIHTLPPQDKPRSSPQQ